MGGHNRKIQVICLILLLFLSLVTQILLPNTIIVTAIAENIEQGRYLDSYGSILKYSEKINGSLVPQNKTLLSIPSINYTLPLKNTPDNNSQFIFRIDIKNYETVHLNDTSKYKYALNALFVFKDIDQYFEIPPKCDFIIDPFLIGHYHFKDINQAYSVFNGTMNNGELFDYILNHFGGKSLVSFVFKNGSEFFPLLGPYELSYYKNLKEEQVHLDSSIQELADRNVTVFKTFLWDYEGNQEDVNVSSRLDINSTVWFEKETTYYKISLKVGSFLSINKGWPFIQKFFSKIRYVNKESNTSLEISKYWIIYRRVYDVVLDSNSSEKNGLFSKVNIFDEFWFVEIVIPLFFLSKIKFGRKKVLE